MKVNQSEFDLRVSPKVYKSLMETDAVKINLIVGDEVKSVLRCLTEKCLHDKYDIEFLD